MNRRIIIKNGEGRFDVPSFTLSDNEDLTVEVCAPIERGKVYYLKVCHGQNLKRFVLTGNTTVEFSAQWLKQNEGEPILFELELRDKSGVSIYKKYDIEPLEIKSSSFGMEYVASVQAVQKENAELKKKLDHVNKELAEVKKILGNIPAKIEKAKRDAVIEAAGGDPMGA